MRYTKDSDDFSLPPSPSCPREGDPSIPLFDISLDVQRILVEYIGVALSALIPFLPPTYFTCWDIVLCLGGMMNDKVEVFSGYVKAFEKLKVYNDRTGFMIRIDDQKDDVGTYLMWGLDRMQSACIVVLAAHSPSPSILLHLVDRISDEEFLMDCTRWRYLKRSDMEGPHWAERIIETIDRYDPSAASDFVHKVLMREAQHVEFPYDDLIYLSGGYRERLKIYDAVSIIENERITTGAAIPHILREMNITLSDREVATIGSKYLLDVKRVQRDFPYLIRLFSLSYQIDGKICEDREDPYPTEIYNTYIPRYVGVAARQQFLYPYFLYHRTVAGTVPTDEQREIMRRILPQPDLTPYQNAILCRYFRIDLGEIILSFLGTIDEHYDPEVTNTIPEFLFAWTTILEEKERILHNPRIYRTYEGSWREVGPYKRFMRNLVRISNERWIAAELLRGCPCFMDRVVCGDDMQVSLREM